jgi:hypothetical protein
MYDLGRNYGFVQIGREIIEQGLKLATTMVLSG